MPLCGWETKHSACSIVLCIVARTHTERVLSVCLVCLKWVLSGVCPDCVLCLQFTPDAVVLGLSGLHPDKLPALVIHTPTTGGEYKGPYSVGHRTQSTGHRTPDTEHRIHDTGNTKRNQTSDRHRIDAKTTDTHTKRERDSRCVSLLGL